MDLTFVKEYIMRVYGDLREGHVSEARISLFYPLICYIQPKTMNKSKGQFRWWWKKDKHKMSLFSDGRKVCSYFQNLSLLNRRTLPFLLCSAPSTFSKLLGKPSFSILRGPCTSCPLYTQNWLSDETRQMEKLRCASECGSFVIMIHYPNIVLPAKK